MNNFPTDKISHYLSKIWFLWVACLAANIITFLFIYYKIQPAGKTLALHYNVLVGVGWYGNGNNLYFVPGVGLIILGVNFVLFRALKNYNTLLSYLTIFTSLGIQLILLTAVIFLSTVN